MGKLPRVSHSSITQGSPHDELPQSKPLEMGLSVSRRVHPEVPEESDLRRAGRLARQRESDVEEGHLMADHVHMLLSIQPKHAVADVIGYIKGKSAIHIAREFAWRPRAILSGNTSGPGATSCPRSVATSRRSERTSRSRSGKTAGNLAAAQFCRAILLGPGLLRVHGRSRRAGDPSVHPGVGAGRPPARPTTVRGEVATRRVAQVATARPRFRPL